MREVIYGAIGVAFFAGWAQHVYTCLMAGSIGFLAVGTIILPLGVIHGWGTWLGVW